MYLTLIFRITSAEKKIHLLVEALYSYDEKTQELRDLHKTYEDFSHVVKRRQLLLNQLWKEEEQKNKGLTLQFQQECE